MPQNVVTAFCVIEVKSKSMSECRRITEPNVLTGRSNSFQQVLWSHVGFGSRYRLIGLLRPRLHCLLVSHSSWQGAQRWAKGSACRRGSGISSPQPPQRP